MAKHTGEPWVAGDNEMGTYTIWEGVLEEVGDVIAEVKEEANAKRIEATINACAEIPTEALEDGVVKEMRDALQNIVLKHDTGRLLSEELELTPARAALDKADKKA